MKKMYLVLSMILVAMLCLIFASATVFAVTACPDPFTFTQPNGDLVVVSVFGDEYLSWSEDNTGSLIIFDETQNGYCYAEWKDSGAVSTGNLVGANFAVLHSSAAKHSIPLAVINSANEIREAELIARRALLGRDPLEDLDNLGLDTPPIPANVSALKRNVLIVHVTWTDRTNISTPKLTGALIYDLVFNPITNSVNRYYKELIGTDEDIILPANVSSPLDGKSGVIEVKMPGSHTNPGNQTEPRRLLMTNAITKACADKIIDLSKFDTNKNGVLETTELSIGFIVDGYEASAGARTPNFWGVSTTATPAASATNGVRIASYFGQGAFHRTTGNNATDLLTVGIICHELGHSGYAFNDTYDYGTLTGSSTSAGHGYWSLMAQGSWSSKSGEYSGATPSYADAYNLVRSGFVKPGTADDYQSVTLNSPMDIYLAKSSSNSRQYFLLQQRKYGADNNYDRGCFYRISSASGASHGGLLIYHIDESVSLTRINDKPSHYLAGIEEAHGGTQNLQQTVSNRNNGDLNDLWGAGGRATFDHNSNPSSGLYSAFTNNLTPPTQTTPSGVAIVGINWNSGTGSTTFTMTGLPAVLNSIAVTTLPTKTAYFAGEPLDLTGMVVTATYSDNSTKTVIGYSTNPANGAALNTVGSQTVTVSYTEGGVTRTATFNIMVNAPPVVLDSIAVTAPPTKTVYTVGEPLDLAGMAVTATYSDGSSKLVTGYTTIPINNTVLGTAGSQTVTVSYTEDGVISTATFTVLVNAAPVVLDSIAITTPPNKTAYTAGEPLDLTGMVVTATYSDGSTKAVTGYITNPLNGAVLNLIGTHTISVSYTEGGVTKTTGTTVTVNTSPVVLESIAITVPPNKTVYSAGEPLNLAGMVVTATYSDGSAKAVTGYITNPLNGAVLNNIGTHTISVSYTEGGVTKTTSTTVTVIPVVLDSISITAPPNKTAYTAGESLNLTGMVVTATYSDGSAKAITGYTTNPLNGAVLNTTGIQTISVSYTEGGVTKIASFTVTVSAPPVVLDHIVVTSLPTKTVYTAGEPLNLAGMVVTATYSDNSAKTVSGYTTVPVNGAILNTIGTQTISVSYTEGGVSKITSFTVTVNAPPPPVLSSIAVTAQPTKKIYTVGETLNLSGMAVTAYYSNNSSKLVTVYTTTPANGAILNTVGTQTISVSYTEGGVTRTTTLTVTVNASVTVTPTAVVEKLSGNQNKLTITVTEKYANGTTNVITGSFTIANNGSGTFNVGAYKVYVATKGNNQVSECRIVP